MVRPHLRSVDQVVVAAKPVLGDRRRDWLTVTDVAGGAGVIGCLSLTRREGLT